MLSVLTLTIEIYPILMNHLLSNVVHKVHVSLTARPIVQRNAIRLLMWTLPRFDNRDDGLPIIMIITLDMVLTIYS